MLKKSWSYIKRQWLPHLIAYSAKITIRLLLITCRIRIHNLQSFIKTAEKSPCIVMLWHKHLVLISEILNSRASQFTYTGFISKSRDGDSLASLVKSYPNGRAIRVPHNARHLALGKLIENLKNKNEVMVITPDGPRGPSCIIKPGVIMAARETGAMIIPFSWKSKRFWVLNTWDRMEIPQPFTTIDVMFGEPLTVDKDDGEVYIDDALRLKHALDNTIRPEEGKYKKEK